MITCIAIDDEPLALEVIQAFCSRIVELELKKVFTSISEARKYLKIHPVDLIFLDIQMQDINGIEFYKELNSPPLLILTTAHAEYAVEGFNIKAVDFLLKPIPFHRFELAVKKAKETHSFSLSNRENEERFLLVRSEYALVKIAFKEILFIETLDDYIKVHQEGKKVVLTIMSLKKVLEKLPQYEFIRVHRSYVVPLKRIESVRGKHILIGDQEIPIGKNYEKEFFEIYYQRGV